MHKPTPPAVRRQAVKLYRQGLSLREAGEACGLSHNAVRRYVQAVGEPRRRGRVARADIPPAAELVRMHARWGSWDAVAYVLCCARWTVMRRVLAAQERES